jgi:hypothetical protein
MLARHYRDIGKPDQARIYYEKALVVVQRIGDAKAENGIKEELKTLS